MQTIKFGSPVEDIVTGMTGIVTGFCTYITGCDQYLIQPPAKDGAHVDGRWVDVARLRHTTRLVVDPDVRALADGVGDDMPTGADIAAPIK